MIILKVVYHERYNEVYSGDPAAAPGRIESIYDVLSSNFEFVKPGPATESDLKLVHTDSHIKQVKRNELTYEIAILAVGGAINASELAMEFEPAFGLIRPPGHHASSSSCWGFCYFNNMAISVERLRVRNKIKKALIVDIDLHFGDGTSNIFRDVSEIDYFHASGANGKDFLNDISNYLSKKRNYDLIAVSAGFDRHEDDWGKMLSTEDYSEIGKIMKDFSEEVCEGRRYGVLEGGYNHEVLGKNVKSLLDGMR
ncbi:MAG: histone deacetylase family protein [Promethearchaeota archaeon]